MFIIFKIISLINVIESHKDGHPHLHIGIWCHKAVRTRDAHFWDFIANQHGNYQSTKNAKAWFIYINKEDMQPCCYGVPPPFLQHALENYRKKESRAEKFLEVRNELRNKSDRVVELVQAGEPLSAILSDMKGYGMLNFQKIKTYTLS